MNTPLATPETAARVSEVPLWRPALSLFVVLSLITGLAYPFVVLSLIHI